MASSKNNNGKKVSNDLSIFIRAGNGVELFEFSSPSLFHKIIHGVTRRIRCQTTKDGSPFGSTVEKVGHGRFTVNQIANRLLCRGAVCFFRGWATGMRIVE
jgi:hypothetical protein